MLGLSVYYDDAVFRWTGGDSVEFGMILEGGSFLDSTNEIPAKDDQVHVAWFPMGTEERVRESEICLMERSLSPGDFVKKRQKSGGPERLGTCKRCVEACCDVRIAGSRRVLLSLPSNKLVPMEPFRVNQHVLFHNWIGIVEDLHWELILRTGDGLATAVVRGAEAATHLHDLDSGRENLPTYLSNVFYPGQQLWAHKSFIQTLPWVGESPLLSKTNSDVMRVYVAEYRMIEIWVIWFCSVKSKPISQPDQNIPRSQFDNVKIITDEFLQPFSIGMHCYYCPSSSDRFITLSDWHDLLIDEFISNHPQKITPSENSQIVSCSSIKDATSTNTDIVDVDTREVKGNDKDDLFGNLLNSLGNLFGEDMLTSSTLAVCEDVLADIIDKVDSSLESSERAFRAKYIKNLKKLNSFNKRRSLKISKMDSLSLPYSKKETELIHSIDRSYDKFDPFKKVVVVEILRTHSILEVEWQDGFKELISSTDLSYMEQFDNLEYFPGDFIVAQKRPLDPGEYGVVVSADYQERTAKVNWFEYDYKNRTPSLMTREKQEVSVYDIMDHSSFNFKIGACVVYLNNTDIPEDNGSGSCGQIYDIDTNGKVELILTNGKRVSCFPQDICFIFDHTKSDERSEEDDDDESWDTVSNEPSPKHEPNLSIKMMFESENETFEKFDYLSHTFKGMLIELYETFHDKDRLELLGNMATFIFKELKPLSNKISNYLQMEENESIKMYLDDIDISQMLKKLLNETIDAYGFINNETIKNAITELFDVSQEGTSKEVAKIKEKYFESSGNIIELEPEKEIDLKDSPVTEQQVSPVFQDIQAPKLEILDFVSESHHYFNTEFKPTNQIQFQKRIAKEISILNSSLPEGILVKGFADRMDLYSAMIQGPKGTPYEDGLFFFDILLPGSYPRSPPEVHYISFCSEKLNPNLYEEGRVCISLLGTWNGEGPEMWNASTSNLLQLMVSIQGLILVAEPYFNEAGYDRQIGTEKGKENSRIYNELVLLKLLQSTIKIIKDPLELFKDEIIEHFRTHGMIMYSRLKRWNDSPETIGPNDKPAFSLFPPSKGFCLSMKNSLETLKEVLSILQ